MSEQLTGGSHRGGPGLEPDNRPRLFKTEGLVLRGAPLGEADRLVTVLTPELGKLRATVRGARRVTSRLGGHLDILNRVSLSLARGRQIDVITGAEALETFGPLKGDLDRVAGALYLMELADALLPEGSPHPGTYTLLLESLRTLSDPPPGAAPSLVLRYGELRLLADTGFMPELRRCVVCGTEVRQGHHRFAPAEGGVVCDVCPTGQARHSAGGLPTPGGDQDAGGPNTGAGWRALVLPLPVDALKVLRYLATHTLDQACRLRLGPDLALRLEALLGASVYHVLEREVAAGGFIEHLRRLRTK